MERRDAKSHIWRMTVNAATALGLAMLVYNGLTTIFGGSGATAVHAQNDPFLARRVDILEQRLYSIESRLSQVSMQPRPSIASPLPSTTQNDIDLLRTSVDSLRVRLGEVECGVLKLDERTLPAAQRRSTRPGVTADKCRENFAAPVMLSARP